MVEWFKAAVLKIAVAQVTEGSNPSLSAILFSGFESLSLRHSFFLFYLNVPFKLFWLVLIVYVKLYDNTFLLFLHTKNGRPARSARKSFSFPARRKKIAGERQLPGGVQADKMTCTRLK